MGSSCLDSNLSYTQVKLRNLENKVIIYSKVTIYQISMENPDLSIEGDKSRILNKLKK